MVVVCNLNQTKDLETAISNSILLTNIDKKSYYNVIS